MKRTPVKRDPIRGRIRLPSGEGKIRATKCSVLAEDERVEDQQPTPSPSKWHGADRISKRFDKLKVGDPFASRRSKLSNFELAYRNGEIPCRVNHGGVTTRLKWDQPPEELSYNPLLVTVSDGLRETRHPYVFVAQNAFKELLCAEGAKEKILPLLPQVVRNIRAAMLKDCDDTFLAALLATQQLSMAVGEELTTHIGSSLLIQINKKSFNRKLKDTITDTLHVLEQHGGSGARELIKSKVPCYV